MGLSCCTYASDISKLELPFKEVILSAIPIADELIIINSNQNNNEEIYDILDELYEQGDKQNFLDKIKTFDIPFPKRLRKNCYVLQRSNAIAQCTKEWILLLDGDEVLHEEDYDKIYKLMEIGDKEGYIAFNFKVLHFYRDYKHYKTSDWWYKKRPMLFKNNLGIFDGYRSWIENGEIKTEYTSDLTTWNYQPLMKYSKDTSVRAFHYGYVRSDECMLQKYNEMETWFHNDNKTQKDRWVWDMNDTEIYVSHHPKVMQERINIHMKEHLEYYV